MCRLFATLGLTLPLLAHAQTAPSTQPDQQLKKLIAGLNDYDATVRDQSAEDLMGLSADDLPALQKAVAKSKPIFPSQAALLHEVVCQVYQASLPYDGDPAQAPCLGLDFREPQDTISYKDSPVRVWSRFPGFSTYRVLRDGDVILALADRPDVLLTHGNFQEEVQKRQAGQTVGLIINRHGHTFTVYCELRVRPLSMGTTPIFEDWLKPREAQAEKYWQDHFAPLIEDTAS